MPKWRRRAASPPATGICTTPSRGVSAARPHTGGAEVRYDWAYRAFYRWGSIVKASSAHRSLKHSLKHLAYHAGVEEVQAGLGSRDSAQAAVADAAHARSCAVARGRAGEKLMPPPCDSVRGLRWPNVSNYRRPRQCRVYRRAGQIRSQPGAMWTAIGGTLAMFAGVGSPITETFGLGMHDRCGDAISTRSSVSLPRADRRCFTKCTRMPASTSIPRSLRRGYRPLSCRA